MPNLDLNIISTHNKTTIGIGDNSTYDMTPVSPTLEVTVPGFNKVTLTFSPKTLTVYNSNSLGMTTNAVNPDILPDGAWVVKYSVFPNYENYFNFTFLKTDLIEEKYYSAFLSMDINGCDNKVKRESRLELSDIWGDITTAKAAASVCNLTLAMKLYAMADRKLNLLNKHFYGLSNCQVQNVW